MLDEIERKDESQRFSDLLTQQDRPPHSLHLGDDQRQKPKQKRSDWNPDRLPVWHPRLQWQLLWWILTAPDRMAHLYQSEYMRKEIGSTGTRLALTLMLIPLAVLVLALYLNPLPVDLFTRESLLALVLLCTAMGMAATVAAVSDKPFMGFLAFMTAFFAGLIIGMVSALIVERFTTAAYALARPSIRGQIYLVLLVLAQLAGFGLLVAAR